MPSVTYMNNSAPFWDFIASLEQQSNDHPLFGQNRNEDNERGERHQPQHDGPSFGTWANFFGGPLPHRGPPHHEPYHDEEPKGKEAENNKDNNDEEVNEANENGEGPSGNSGSDNEGCTGGRGRHGRCGSRRRGHCGPDRSGRHARFGGPCGGPSGFWGHRGPPHHGHHGGPHRGRGFGRRGGGWGPFSYGHPFAGNFAEGFDPSTLFTQFWDQFNDTDTSNQADKAPTEDHTPDADVFDTEIAYIVHFSLPGAKKEDVGVNWDAEKSELSIAGVIYRPGDEEFLKTLAMSERKVGPFERKIRLGTRATPAHIDADSISAKLEDGVLRVEVPKLDAGYVEVKKVDIE